MASRNIRFVRPLLYTSAAVAAGAGVLYITYRPRNIPGSEPAVVPPPGYKSGKLVPPDFPRIKSREEQIADLKRSKEEEYDLLVIGGGATGSGIALDAATRGLKVAVVERDDFSAGTSSKSTKLVHGGVRYLEKAVWELDYNQYVAVDKEMGLGRSRDLTGIAGTSWSRRPCESASTFWTLRRISRCGCRSWCRCRNGGRPPTSGLGASFMTFWPALKASRARTF